MAGPIEGVILGEAKDYLKSFYKRVRKYKRILRDSEITLNSVKQLNDEITRRCSDEQARELGDIVNEFKRVVGKCNDNKFWFWDKAKYAKKLQDLDKRLRRCLEINGLAKIWEERILKSKPLSPPNPPEHNIVGLEKPIEHLKKMVFADNDSCGPVVITGLPGSGKTTLATIFCHDPQIKEKFGEHIFFTTVSSEPDHEYLKKLANRIKETEEDRDTLLVLDDVWPKDGEDIINQFVFKKQGYKILVTSRSSFPTLHGSQVYKLEKLSEEDAEAVFRDAAKPDPELEVDDLVKKIVNRLRASPLALKVIGASLKGEEKSSWTAKAHEWAEGGSVSNYKDIWDVVKTSLDSLDNDGLSREKECFLDLGSFPEDQRIPATALRDIWMEKYEKHDEAGATALHRLKKLSTRNLINFNLPSKHVDEIEGSSNDHYVRQHDLLRDLAIDCSNQGPIEERTRLIANIQGNDFPHWWAKQKNLDKAELLSISTDEAFSSRWKYNLRAPNLEVLVLNSRTDYALPGFINEMNQLRVIVITNYGFSHAQLHNTQVLTDLRNLTRIRFERFFVTSIPKMANLEKLSLIMCKFGDTFADHANDIASSLPNLIEFEIDQPSGLKKLPSRLCNIIELKRLGITYCQELVELPEELGKLTNLEALRLHSCTELKELPDSLCELRSLKHLDITDCYAIDKLPERMGELSSLESLHMRRCGGPWGLKDLPTSVGKLKSLKKVICSEETAPEWRNFKDLTNLKSIDVPEEDYRKSFARIMGE